MRPSGELVGRSQHVDRLAGLLRGELRAVAVAGDAGIGKTTLLDGLADRARTEGWVVARYECVEAERDFPYAALSYLLRPSTATSPPSPTTSAAPSTSCSGAGPATLPP